MIITTGDCGIIYVGVKEGHRPGSYRESAQELT